MKSLENGTILLRPFLLYLGLEPRKRVVDDLDFECAELATLLTYRDSQTVIKEPQPKPKFPSTAYTLTSKTVSPLC
ncbi:MAG: hypothetical protein ACUVXA_15560 [Candidatus Jordarchaeum sp.]|uniref:hypothetical protein n=1 Tax=Candidatus Jordarchaeum sp. TaxID=2823881 RepID=UPI00404B2984